MLTIQTLVDIAMRYATYMSDAMIIACIQRHYATGEPLVVPSRSPIDVPDPLGVPLGAEAGYELVEGEWRRLVEGNADTRWQHV